MYNFLKLMQKLKRWMFSNNYSILWQYQRSTAGWLWRWRFDRDKRFPTVLPWLEEWRTLSTYMAAWQLYLLSWWVWLWWWVICYFYVYISSISALEYRPSYINTFLTLAVILLSFVVPFYRHKWMHDEKHHVRTVDDSTDKH